MCCASLQGLQKPVFKNEKDENGNAKMVLAGVEPMTPGRHEAGGV